MKMNTICVSKVTRVSMILALALGAMSQQISAQSPPPLPPTSSDWNVFFALFTKAVEHRDRFALEKLMARHVDLTNFQYSPIPGDELNGLEPVVWVELSRAISHGTQPRRGYKPPDALEDRVAFTCLKCSVQGNVDFIKGQDGQWRWAGLFYPND